MTINESYLVARYTGTINYIPVMTPGLYDTFPRHIGPFSWTSFDRYIDNLTLDLGEKYLCFGLISNSPAVTGKGSYNRRTLIMTMYS